VYTQKRTAATPRTNRRADALHTLAMTTNVAGRALLRLGVCSLLVAGAAGAWELSALQSPGTPLYIGVLPGPIAALRELATTLGLLLVVVAAWVPRVTEGGRSLRVLVAALSLGTVLALSAQTYGSAHGMYVLQAIDLRSDELPVFVLKYCGLLVFAAAAAELARRVCFARSPTTDRSGTGTNEEIPPT
jgi:hypothetical protein